MKVAKAQLREDLQALLGQLAPYGIKTSGQLAGLLRNGSLYPSGAYVRLMLSPRETPQPSERFCRRVYSLKEYVQRGLAEAAPDFLLTLERVLVRDGYHPEARLRFLAPTAESLKPDEVVLVREVGGKVDGALVYVSGAFVARCAECGAVFFKRSPRARYCRVRCRRMAAQRRASGKAGQGGE